MVAFDPETGERNASWIWALDLLIALAIAAVVTVFVIGRYADQSCVDAGGRVLRGGLDRLCEFADGRREPLAATRRQIPGWAIAYGGWLALTMMLYWCGRRFIRHRGPGQA